MCVGGGIISTVQGMPRVVSRSGEAAEAAAAAVTAALPLLRRLAGRGGPLEATRRPDPGRDTRLTRTRSREATEDRHNTGIMPVTRIRDS